MGKKQDSVNEGFEHMAVLFQELFCSNEICHRAYTFHVQDLSVLKISQIDMQTVSSTKEWPF